MGKTPKEKVNERRRPYNYLRNAQGQFSGNETRNHYYSSGSVQRPVTYHRLRAAAPNQFYRGPFRGELYRERSTNIPKLGKPTHLKRHLPNKKIVSPLKRAAKRSMQSDLEKQKPQCKESTGELVEQQHESKEEGEEHNLKNGPAENNSDEDKEKMENGLAADVDGPEKAPEQDLGNLDDANPGPKGKSAAKEKKSKKNEATSKAKGRYSPKSAKEKSLESTEPKISEKSETEITEIEVETKDKKTKKVKKETESHTTSDHTQPTVKVLRLNPQTLAANSEMNDSSIIEIPVVDAVPSTSSDWPLPTGASPRRSTRLQEQKNIQDDSIIIVQKNDEDDSVLVLENESKSVTEISRSSKNISFAEALTGMRGRRSLRPLPPLNLPSRLHTFSSRVPTLTISPDPVGQEIKTRSFSSVYHKSSKSVTTTTSDLAADNDLDDAANSSSTEESGTEVDATSSEPSSTAAEDVNMSGKRKISNIQPLDEVQQEHKRFRSINEEQMNSSGFFSMISSPMNAFASRIKSGKSSTPVNLLKVTTLNEEDASHLTEEVSEIVKEETGDNVEMFTEKSEKESLEIAVQSQSGQSEAPQKKWCSIM